MSSLIFPLQQRAREDVLHRLHEFLDEGVVFRPAHPPAAVAEIEWILQQRAVIRADVQADRQREGRMNASPRRVEPLIELRLIVGPPLDQYRKTSLLRRVQAKGRSTVE